MLTIALNTVQLRVLGVPLVLLVFGHKNKLLDKFEFCPDDDPEDHKSFYKSS